MALVPGKTVAQMAGESVTQDADLFYFLRGSNDFGITFVDLQTQFMGGITIEAGSQNYLGWNPATSELSMKALAITDVTVDATEISLAAYLAANYTVGDEHQEGDVIYLTAATGGTEAYIHNGGTAVTAADFEIINFPVITSLTGLTDTASASVNDGFLQWNAGGTQVEYVANIGEIYGGTGQNSYATGDMLYASGANTLTKLAAGSNTEVLTLAGGVPTWAAIPVIDSGNILDTTGLTATGNRAHTINDNLTVRFSNQATTTAKDMLTIYARHDGGAVGIDNPNPTSSLHVGDSAVGKRPTITVEGDYAGSNGWALIVKDTAAYVNWSPVAYFESAKNPEIKLWGRDNLRGGGIAGSFQSATVSNNFLTFGASSSSLGGHGGTGMSVYGDNRVGINVIPSASTQLHLRGADTYIPLRVDTFQLNNVLLVTALGKTAFTPATALTASISLPHGAAPSSPINGDMWTTTAGAFARVNGVTVDLTDTGVASGDGIYDGSGAIPVGTTTITMAANDLHFSAADGFTKFTKTGGDFILDLENTNNHTKVAYQQGNQGNLAITQWFNGSAAWGAARMAGNLWTRAYERDKFALYTSGAAGDAGIDIAAKNAAGVINFHVGGGTGTLAISTERMIIANTTITNKVRTLIGVGVVDATAMTHITGQSSGAINPLRVDTNGVIKALYVNSLAKVFMAGSVEMGATPSTGSGKFTMTGTVGNETLLINSENASSSTSPLTCYSLTNRIFRVGSSGNVDMNGTLNVGKNDNTTNGQLHIFANSAGGTDILTVKNQVLTTVFNVEAGGSTQITGKVQVGGQDSGYLASNGGIGIKSTASVSNSVRVLRMQSNVAGELFAVTTTGKVGIQKLLPTETLEIGTGQVKLAVGTSSKAALMLPPSVAVTSSPLDGEVWLTTTGMFARINGVTKQLDGAGADGNGIYTGSGTVPSAAIATITDKLSFNGGDVEFGGLVSIGGSPVSSPSFGTYPLTLIGTLANADGVQSVIQNTSDVGMAGWYINQDSATIGSSAIGRGGMRLGGRNTADAKHGDRMELFTQSTLGMTFTNYTTGDWKWYATSTQRMHLTSGGELGIGITPSAKLHVVGTGAVVFRADTASIDNTLLVNSNGTMLFGGTTAAPVGSVYSFNGNNVASAVVAITAGSTAPNYALSCYSSVGATLFQVSNAKTAATGVMEVNGNGKLNIIDATGFGTDMLNLTSNGVEKFAITNGGAVTMRGSMTVGVNGAASSTFTLYNNITFASTMFAIENYGNSQYVRIKQNGNIDTSGSYVVDGVSGVSQTGNYDTFTISGGIITAASLVGGGADGNGIYDGNGLLSGNTIVDQSTNTMTFSQTGAGESGSFNVRTTSLSNAGLINLFSDNSGININAGTNVGINANGGVATFSSVGLNITGVANFPYKATSTATTCILSLTNSLAQTSQFYQGSGETILHSSTDQFRFETTTVNMSIGATSYTAKLYVKGDNAGTGTIPLRVDTNAINDALTVGSNANTGFGLSPAASRRVQIQGETATSGTYSMYVTDSASGDLFTIRNDGYSAFGRTPSSVARLITKGKGTTSTTASFISKNSADTDTLRIGDDGTIDMYNELTLTLSTDSDLRSTFSNPSVGTSARSSLDVNNGTSNLFHEIYSTLYTNTYIRNKGVIRANSQSDGIVINSGNNISGTIELGVSTSANNLTTATTALFINTNRTVHIGNGVGAPDASAVLEISGSTGGVVVPRMAAATASLISSPIDGNILYVTTTDGTFTSVGIWAREAGSWIKL